MSDLSHKRIVKIQHSMMHSCCFQNMPSNYFQAILPLTLLLGLRR